MPARATLGAARSALDRLSATRRRRLTLATSGQCQHGEQPQEQHVDMRVEHGMHGVYCADRSAIIEQGSPSAGPDVDAHSLLASPQRKATWDTR